MKFALTNSDSSGKPATGAVAITFSLYELQEVLVASLAVAT
jgi:hypothetical protein